MQQHNPTMLWEAGAVKEATGGLLVAEHNWQAAGFSIDTRTLQPGQCYIALIGEQHDGHRFLPQAQQAGAVAAIVSDAAALPEGMSAVVVKDTLAALQALGRWRRERSRARIIGITGSVGKTGGKELLRHMLSGQARVYATAGNFNNHIGLPLCLANMPEATEIGIFEMGMNHAGEIADLTMLASPDISMITTVEAVHLEHFRSVEEIALAKAEIFRGQKGKEHCAGILPADSPYLPILQKEAQESGVERVLTFGEHGDADCQLESYTPLPIGAEVTLRVGDLPMHLQLGASGKHWALLAAAGLLVVELIGGDLPQAAVSLAHFSEPAGRGKRSPLRLQNGQAVLIDDSYNASPVSMRAAFTALSQTPVPEGGRRIAVLGDMLELGPEAPAMHRQLAEPLTEAGIDTVLTAGGMMRELQERLPEAMQGGHGERPEALVPLLMQAVRPGDVVLVKGSHGSRMHGLADALLHGALAGEKESVHAV